MTITTLVVDDEPLARRAIVRQLGNDPDIELLAECGDGASAVQAIRQHSPDLVSWTSRCPRSRGST